MNRDNLAIEKRERELTAVAIINIFLGLVLIAFVAYAYFTWYKPAKGVVSRPVHEALLKAYANVVFLVLPTVALTYIYLGFWLRSYLRFVRSSRRDIPN